MTNEIIRTEFAGSMLGVPGRFYSVVADNGLIRNQKFATFPREFQEGGRKYSITATVRFDDECKNGHESFSITGSIHVGSRLDSCGCIHEDIARHFPELACLIKWHLVSTDGPMHYIANTLYHAGDRDHNGLLKGEKRQIKNGRTGEPCWHLVGVGPDGEEVEVHSLPKYADGDKPETVPGLEWGPWCRTGEGKERELDAARASAVWPEATDEQLCLPREELEKLLIARLPALLGSFKAAMESTGFVIPSSLA